MAGHGWLLGISVAALTVAGAPAGASDFGFAWIQTSGGLPPAGAVPQLAPGDTAVLEVRVHADSIGVWGASIGVAYDPTLLQLVGFERCPAAPGNEFGGLGTCGTRMEPLGFASLLPVSTGLPLDIDNSAGQAGVFAAECGGECGQYDWTFELVHLTFEVPADPPGLTAPQATQVETYYPVGISGIGSTGSSVLAQPYHATTLFIVPKAPGVPASPGPGLLLLGAALLGLGACLARSS